MNLTEKIKKNWKSVAIIVSSITFGFIAVFLGGSLYLTRNVSISPNAPQSIPHAAAPTTCQGLSVTFATPVGTTTPLPSASATSSSSPLALAVPPTSTATESPTDTPTPTATATNSATATPTPTPTSSPSSTATATPTSTSTATTSTTIACGGTCLVNSTNCGSGMQCLLVGSSYKCANPSCSSDSSCTCGTTIVPSPVANQLPHAGVGLPTMSILGLAVILILGSFLLI